jgi:hypothetical protein
MSNQFEISECHIDSFSIKDNLLVAYPNKLIYGCPTYVNCALYFKKNSYLKIRMCDLEKFYLELINMIAFFECELTEEQKTIFKDSLVNCTWSGDELSVGGEKKKTVKIFLIEKDSSMVFSFDKENVQLFLIGFGELLPHCLCLTDECYQCFVHLLNHFLTFKKPTVLAVSKNIASLTKRSVFECIEKIVERQEIKCNIFMVSNILFRFKQYLLIMYRIRKIQTPVQSTMIEKFTAAKKT